MSAETTIANEQQAATAFSKQSAVFDAIYCPNKIIQYKRQRVRSHIERYLPQSAQMLELNAGTGEDATYFAANGHQVHATDIAPGMLAKLAEKVAAKGLQQQVSIEQASYTALGQLRYQGPFDYVYSNFAGLNCTDKLPEILQTLHGLLKPGGCVTLVLLPPFCLWELALALRGNFKAAFRRFNSRNGVEAYVEGVPFTCWYYKPSFVATCAADKFEVVGLEGLCTLVPPSYFEHFPDKRPRLYRWLQRLEDKWKSLAPWRNIGDYYIITLRRS